MNSEDFLKTLDSRSIEEQENLKFEIIIKLLTEIRDLLKNDTELKK